MFHSSDFLYIYLFHFLACADNSIAVYIKSPIVVSYDANIFGTIYT